MHSIIASGSLDWGAVFAYWSAISLICDNSLLLAGALLKSWDGLTEHAAPVLLGFQPLPGRISASFMLHGQAVAWPID